MPVGYHYTSMANWGSIRQQGLQPYSIYKPALEEYIGANTVQGIWIWLYKQSGLSHVGSILYQMGTRATTEVVLLRVVYSDDDILTPRDEPERQITLVHDGHIGNLMYHTGKEVERAVIVVKPIPPKNIDLLAAYNLLDAWSD